MLVGIYFILLTQIATCNCQFCLTLLNRVLAQNFYNIQSLTSEAPVDRRIKIVWCTINFEEQKKCENFLIANERDRIRVGYDYFRLDCYQASNKDECMTLLDEGKVKTRKNT